MPVTTVAADPTVETERATFALSWFWFPEAQFGCASGVIRTRVGFTGGSTEFPTYHNLWAFNSFRHIIFCQCLWFFVDWHAIILFCSADHTETVDVEYDPKVTSYNKLLNLFWNSHDSTACHSRQYMSAIFYHNEEQKQQAEETKQVHQKKKMRPIATKILPAQTFYNAEE